MREAWITESPRLSALWRLNTSFWVRKSAISVSFCSSDRVTVAFSALLCDNSDESEAALFCSLASSRSSLRSDSSETETFCFISVSSADCCSIIFREVETSACSVSFSDAGRACAEFDSRDRDASSYLLPSHIPVRESKITAKTESAACHCHGLIQREASFGRSRGRSTFRENWMPSAKARAKKPSRRSSPRPGRETTAPLRQRTGSVLGNS